MAEEIKEKKPERREEKNTEETLVRIFNKDLPGSKNIYSGLTKIKGISWAVSSAICIKSKVDKVKRIRDLNREEITRIEEVMKDFNFPHFLKNRQKDFDSGENKHILAVDLDLRNEFDIKRLKKIKSYRGMRHSLKLPVRGQRTRSHFRKSGIAVGVRKPKTGKKS
ncbi:30S ribosomal protein S13 [Candidatus Pacearchaeota archaeon CG_4_9_14_0_2_um_filter_39_13]|nr:30S ribosomal protein S13 [Candidatus Pacearchaeota archaeon]PJC44917.1 MAG: 30S ribosomal protein S13 [Candidatus Pacearchaeota archaeon CG_4_9_14_0_2_um_filter_39_13]